MSPSFPTLVKTAGCTLGIATLVFVGLPTQAQAAPVSSMSTSAFGPAVVADSSTDTDTDTEAGDAPADDQADADASPSDPSDAATSPEAPVAPAPTPAPAPAPAPAPEIPAEPVASPAPVAVATDAAPIETAPAAAPEAAPAEAEVTPSAVVPLAMTTAAPPKIVTPGMQFEIGTHITWGSYSMPTNRLTTTTTWTGALFVSAREVHNGGSGSKGWSVVGTKATSTKYNSGSGGSGRYSNYYAKLAVPAGAQNGDTFAYTQSVVLAGSDTDSGSATSETVEIMVNGADETRAPEGVTVDRGTGVVSGTGVPGSTITIVDADGKPLETGPVGDDGRFSVSVPGMNAGGLGVTQTIGGVASESVPVRLSTATPDITGHQVIDGKGIVSGTGEKGATVVVRDADGTPIGSVEITAEDGSWTLPLDVDPTGSSVTVTQEADGLVSQSTTVDFITAEATVGEPVVDADGTVHLGGTGAPGSTIVIKDGDGTIIDTVEVDENGDWEYTLPEMPEGGELVVVQENDGIESSPVTVTIDVPAPSLGDVDRHDDGSTTVGGTGLPGSVVEAKDENGDVVASTVVDENGDWTLEIPAQKDGGTITIEQSKNGASSGTISLEVAPAPEPTPGSGAGNGNGNGSGTGTGNSAGSGSNSGSNSNNGTDSGSKGRTGTTNRTGTADVLTGLFGGTGSTFLFDDLVNDAPVVETADELDGPDAGARDGSDDVLAGGAASGSHDGGFFAGIGGAILTIGATAAAAALGALAWLLMALARRRRTEQGGENS
ncbi:Ig-like domain-containing protein [Frondihabitans cladoniiphilus]|uniref:Bacterial Ig domain-containing protein n=1 Tax=Frondihabitans cladoniiphilus TaxID=715785 RepID=A0ABP8VVD2_9MICO